MSDFEAAWLSPVFSGVRFHFLGGSRDGTFAEVGMSGTYSFGRDPEASFPLSDADPVDMMASFQHAYVRVTTKGAFLGRLSAANGLELFNLPAAEKGETLLHDGDLIRLGRGGPRVCVRIGRLDGLAVVEDAGAHGAGKVEP